MAQKITRRALLRTTAATAAVGVGSTMSGAVVAQTASEYAAIEQAVHDEVNRRRSENGLSALEWNATIATAAHRYSEQMATEDFFSHTAPGEDSFADHYRDDGVNCSSLGENILYRTTRSDSPEQIAQNIVDQWMNSSGHRENILSDWQSEGIGVFVTSDGTLYATQGFGSCPGTDGGSGGDETTTTDTPETPTTTDEPDTTTDAPETPDDTPVPETETPDDTPDDTPVPETETPSENETDDWWDDDDDDDGWWGDDDDDGRGDGGHGGRGRGHGRGRGRGHGKGRGRGHHRDRHDRGHNDRDDDGDSSWPWVKVW